MKVTIDRFEGDYAVVELGSKEMLDLPIALVPDEASEGDILEISIDKEATKNRKKDVQRLMDSLWE